MDLLRLKRAPVRSGFTKTANLLSDELSKTLPNTDTLVTLTAQLEDKGKKLATDDENILTLMRQEGCSTEEYEKEYETIENYCDRLTSLLARAKRLLLRLDGNGSNDGSSSAGEPTSRRRFRLPELELKKFSGELKDWLGFWGQFKKIHEDMEIGPEDKFQYLLQATVANTRARQLVESFPPTAESYLKAIDSLKGRFGRDDMLVEVYVRELLRLVLSNALNPKKKISLAALYDNLESQLRALETLGVTTDKYAAMLYPLVESCLPEDVLRTWERNRYSTSVTDTEPGAISQNRLIKLMTFLRTEVDGEERINLARTSFGVELENKKGTNRKTPQDEVDTPTAAALLSGNQPSVKPKVTVCIFCDKQHPSQECSQAINMSLENKKQVVARKGCCFVCLKSGHISRRCKTRHKCPVCEHRHFAVMCPNLPNHQTENCDKVGATNTPVAKDSVLANHEFSPEVLLQTLVVRLRGKGVEKQVRALIDTGSQRSYISVKAATTMALESAGKEKIVHNLFGGMTSTAQDHNRFRIHLSSRSGDYLCNFEVLDQQKICGTIPSVPRGPWLDELEAKGIQISDVAPTTPINTPEIDILIGADVAGKLLTGKVCQLKSGPVAVHTRLGWTLMGKTPLSSKSEDNCASLVTSLFVREASISDLWNLDCLGILDPVESKKKHELQEEALAYFNETVQRKQDGRYEVSLPWIAGHPPLPSNRQLAERRLHSTVAKLRAEKRLEQYQAVIDSWVEEEIIEEIPDHDVDHPTHYLPHRAVIKEASQTTKIRPVFDASARGKKGPSLNDCLEKGPNLIEKIPSVITRFRAGCIGVTSDIKQAFLQINVAEKDRDFLRFLWWENGQADSLKVYRHRRVVFGVSASPFLLGATLSHHLEGSPEHLKATANQLSDSLYVDNCVTSVDDEQQLTTFIQESQELLGSAMFDLRGWCYNDLPPDKIKEDHLTAVEQTGAVLPIQDTVNKREQLVQVLGLWWDLNQDTLHCDVDIHCQLDQPATKRTVLSVAHRVFDPIGFTCPVTLCPKLLLQETWELKLRWDDELPANIKNQFTSWLQELPILREVRVPRCIYVNKDAQFTLHVFCDASKKAYATCIFLRHESKSGVSVQLIQAKARVTPLKPITIPRLELLSCCIGARLAETVKQDLQITDLPVFYWSDSANALCWIQRDDQWGVFVGNRVKEIRTLTDPNSWYYVPGNLNPADLPSRGCTVKQLLKSKWWEGPKWLLKSTDDWPKTETLPDEDQVNEERKKSLISAHCKILPTGWYYNRSSSFIKIVRVIAWVFRFSSNAAKPASLRANGELSREEFEKAESALWCLVQQDSFSGPEDPSLCSLHPTKDSVGVIRVRTSVVLRKDTDSFRQPVLLPSNHPVVQLLILWRHQKLCHAGIHILMTDLREKYWILRSRKTIRQAIRQCGKCKRFTAKKVQVTPPPLPEDRISDAAVFQTVGVDLAGPVFLKASQKAWIVLFTCAVYRAVHLELVTSLSTESFLQALRRFIARRGRPNTIYSDNGTNFVGSARALKQVNWKSIQSYSSCECIEWKFNPPTAAWWGGWWERLIRMLKELLRRVLGRACLQYEELLTVLCDCENVMNSRPLTYVSEDIDDLEPLTPALFLHDIKSTSTPDIDSVDHRKLNKRARHCQKIREDLRLRFRSEYLGQLRLQASKSKQMVISPGDIVLIENDSTKRIEWRLARVTQVFPGRDGQVRVARLQTKTGQLTRPVQRLYPLELRDALDKPTTQPSTVISRVSDKRPKVQDTASRPTMVTRSGRKVVPPDRLSYAPSAN